MSDIVERMPEGPFEATPKTDLERQIMDPNIPKMEREWWAASEITALRAEVEQLRAALEKLSCKCPSNCDWEKHGDICPSWIARAALEEKQ